MTVREFVRVMTKTMAKKRVLISSANESDEFKTTFFALTLNRFKINPALATGPFVTTLNDIIGITIYFLVGRLLYGLF